jgi:hypothetical protein
MAGKLPMQATGGFLSHSLGFINRVEQAEMKGLAVVSDVYEPSLTTLRPSDAPKARLVIDSALAVHTVLGRGRNSQVGKAIVGSIAVDVIDFVKRPPAVGVEPRKLMGLVGALSEAASVKTPLRYGAKGDDNICLLRSAGSGNGSDILAGSADMLAVTRVVASPELAGVWIVAEQFSDLLCGRTPA